MGLSDFERRVRERHKLRHQLYLTDNVGLLCDTAKSTDDLETRNVAFHRLFHMREKDALGECVLDWFLHGKDFDYTKAHQLLNHIFEPVSVRGYGSTGRKALERLSWEGLLVHEANDSPASFVNELHFFIRREERPNQQSGGGMRFDRPRIENEMWSGMVKVQR